MAWQIKPVKADFLTIAVAANVQFAAQEIKTAFQQKYPDQRIEMVVGSSGKIASQIMHGAPFDVFLSADAYYPRRLYEKGLTYGLPKVYARGHLLLWTVKNISLSEDLRFLQEKNIKKIALPNPQTAPYGEAARQLLRNKGIYEHLLSKFVYGESVAQTNQFIFSGASDVGFTAQSAVFTPFPEQKGRWIVISPDLYDPIQQTAVLLRKQGDPNFLLAQSFFDFIFSSQARKILKLYGYHFDDLTQRHE